MPGEVGNMTFREARRAGLVKEWQEEHKPEDLELRPEANTSFRENAAAGDIIGVKQVSRTGEFDKIIIGAVGNIPSRYNAEVRVWRGNQPFDVRLEMSGTTTVLHDLGVNPELKMGDIFVVRLIDTSDDEKEPVIDLVVTTIATKHA